jgi:hypothetical protein
MMKKKINLVVLLVTVCTLTLTSAVSAEENAPEGRVRLIGQVTHVDAPPVPSRWRPDQERKKQSS